MRSCGKPRGYSPDGENAQLMQQLQAQQQQLGFGAGMGLGGGMLPLMGMGGTAMDMGLGAAGLGHMGGMDGFGGIGSVNVGSMAALNSLQGNVNCGMVPSAGKHGQSEQSAPPGSWTCE